MVRIFEFSMPNAYKGANCASSLVYNDAKKQLNTIANTNRAKFNIFFEISGRRLVLAFLFLRRNLVRALGAIFNDKDNVNRCCPCRGDTGSSFGWASTRRI
jgi:hypothetical protein